jgi:hypothetical protein
MSGMRKIESLKMDREDMVRNLRMRSQKNEKFERTGETWSEKGTGYT